METKIVGGAIVVVVLIIAAYMLFFNKPTLTGGSSTTSVTTNSGGQNGAVLFNDSQFASHAYLISGNANLSPAGIAAVSDVNITTKQLQSGAVMYVLAFPSHGVTYNATLQPGQKLYFIDTNLGDDSSTSDFSTGDDGYAIVNATGYQISLIYPLKNT